MTNLRAWAMRPAVQASAVFVLGPLSLHHVYVGGPGAPSAGGVEPAAKGCVRPGVDRFGASVAAMRKADAEGIHSSRVSRVSSERRARPFWYDCAWKLSLAGFANEGFGGTPTPEGRAPRLQSVSVAVVADVIVDAATGRVASFDLGPAPTWTPGGRSTATATAEPVAGADLSGALGLGAERRATVRPYILTTTGKSWGHGQARVEADRFSSRFVYSDSDHYLIESLANRPGSSSITVRNGSLSMTRSVYDGTPSAHYTAGRLSVLPRLLRDMWSDDEQTGGPFVLGAPIRDLEMLDEQLSAGDLVDLGSGRWLGHTLRGVGTTVAVGGYYESWYDPGTGVKLLVRGMNSKQAFFTQARRLDDEYEPDAGDFKIRTEPGLAGTETRILDLPLPKGVDVPPEVQAIRTIAPGWRIQGHRAASAILLTEATFGTDGPSDLRWLAIQELWRDDGASIAVLGAVAHREVQGYDPFWPWNWEGDTPFRPFEGSLFLFAQSAQLGDDSPVKAYTTRCTDYSPRHAIVWTRHALTTVVLSDCRHRSVDDALAVARELTR